MAYKKEKTDKEWKQIRFQNSLGPQIGGLLHDAVALIVAEIRSNKVIEQGDELHSVRERIEHWLDVLYEIAENKKAEITKIKPVDHKAEELGEEWQKKHNKEVELADIEREEQETAIKEATKEQEAQDKLIQP